MMTFLRKARVRSELNDCAPRQTPRRAAMQEI